MAPKKLNMKEENAPMEELEQIASKTDVPEAKLQEAASQAETALAQYKTASSLRSLAETVRDPAKREKYLQEAYNSEIKAHGNSKKARILSSGAFQGSVGGGGIGLAVGAGLGTVVGTVVGTVATIPTTAVGTLVGAGVGGVKGPWIKLGQGNKNEGTESDKKDSEDSEEQKGREDAAAAAADQGIPDPQALRDAADKIAEAREEGAGQAKSSEKKDRKKPRKLEVRSKSAATAASG
ncbi:hypothetical protein ACN47E_006193 [Coniothyrium glycines]